MPLKDFFWLSDSEFAARLRNAQDYELFLDDKHNVRKRKGGKLGAWVGAGQAPWTLGISLCGTAIGLRNRHVAKRRLEMIHAELQRRGLPQHAEDWKDNAFAMLAVGAGAGVGMGFAPGAEYAAQGLAEMGASHAAYVATSVAASETASSIGSLATEVSTAHYTDPDTYFNKGLEAAHGIYHGQQPLAYYGTPGPAPSPPTPHSYSGMATPSPPPSTNQQCPGYMDIPPAPYYV